MNAPGKAFRKGISLLELMRMFPDDETSESVRLGRANLR